MFNHPPKTYIHPYLAQPNLLPQKTIKIGLTSDSQLKLAEVGFSKGHMNNLHSLNQVLTSPLVFVH